MKYQNPIILQDFSDPDVIRVGNDFYMVASSFNYIPGLPVLHSKNLVNWEIINYVFDRFPLAKYDEVHPGHGAWAPSIRYEDGVYYCLIPTPDEGIFVSTTKDPYGKWETPRLLMPGQGLEDPCPIWVDGRCYVVHAFAKSRAGFNSKLALFECDPLMTKVISPSVIIYDGHDLTPAIEGPKFNVRNGYFYILAPAGSVFSGWQVCLRSKNIYGPYEVKVILATGDTLINGPHQGALFTIDDNDNWAFIHFRDMLAYGRTTYLEPVMWHNDWPLPGHVNDPLLYGTPLGEGNYLIDLDSDYKIELSDEFKDKINMSWQTQANPKDNWYYLDKGFNLLAGYKDKIIKYLPNFYSEKIGYYNFTIKTKLNIKNLTINEEAGLCYLGRLYSAIALQKGIDCNKILIYNYVDDTKEEIIKEIPYKDDEIVLKLKFIGPDKYLLGYNDKWFKREYVALKGIWVGGRVGMFARGNDTNYAKFKYFRVKEKENERKGSFYTRY